MAPLLLPSQKREKRGAGSPHKGIHPKIPMIRNLSHPARVSSLPVHSGPCAKSTCSPPFASIDRDVSDKGLLLGWFIREVRNPALVFGIIPLHFKKRLRMARQSRFQPSKSQEISTSNARLKHGAAAWQSRKNSLEIKLVLMHALLPETGSCGTNK